VTKIFNSLILSYLIPRVGVGGDGMGEGKLGRVGGSCWRRRLVGSGRYIYIISGGRIFRLEVGWRGCWRDSKGSWRRLRGM